jgi:hypothetical protein
MIARMRAAIRLATSVGVMLGAASLSAGAQGTLDPRLDARLDAATRAALAPVLDSARAAGLPVEPLVDKALEGASKRAPGPRIVLAVRTLRADLDAARAALGAGSSEPEIVAGVSALRAGVRPSALQQLRESRPGRPLTIPLAVLADLIARGVPVDTAAAVVHALERGGAADEDFVTLRRNVERDVRAGALPAVAASVRAHGVPATVGSPPGRALGRKRHRPIP